jgi:alpha-1,3-fucosyltransferase 10
MSLIVFYNPMFARSAGDLPVHPDCAFSYDRTRLPEADAVIIHVPTLSAPWEVPKFPGQLWVAWSMESTANYPALASDAIMSAFDIRMTYERRSEVWVSYAPGDLRAAATRPPPRKTARAPVVMFQSARHDLSARADYVRRLMASIPVHSYGRFMRNRRLFRFDRGRPTKLAVIGRYKFCLSFENSVAADYVTEKFYDPFVAGTVPVYRGAPNVADFAPGPNAFINADDFRDPEALAGHLLHLDADDAAYREYFRWKESGLSDDFRRRIEEPGKDMHGRLVAAVLRMRAAQRPAAGAAPAYPLAWLKPRGASR